MLRLRFSLNTNYVNSGNKMCHHINPNKALAKFKHLKPVLKFWRLLLRKCHQMSMCGVIDSDN